MVAMLEMGGLAPRATGYKATMCYIQAEFAQGYIIFYLTRYPGKHEVGKFALSSERKGANLDYA